jgi:hypothetical protein
MKIMPLVINQKYRIEVFFVNLIIIFYLFRTSVPFLKFPFLLIYVSFIFYLLLNYRNRILSTLVGFIKNYYLILIISSIQVISFLASNKLYLSIFKDVVNLVILLSIFTILTFVVSGLKEFKFFISNLVYLIVLFAVAISILRLLDLLNIFPLNGSLQVDVADGSTLVESSKIDSNFVLLPVFFGMIGVFNFLRKTNNRLQNAYLNFFLIIFSLNIILSGSRRGLISLVIIICIAIIAGLYMFFKRGNLLKEWVLSFRFFLLSLVSIIIILSLFFSLTSYKFKDKTLEYLGTKNVTIAKSGITINIFKYVSALNKKISYPELYNQMWTSYLPEDPDSGWGSRIHKTIFPLTGKNIEIVPPDAKGYFMDNSCNGSYYAGQNMCESYSIVSQLFAKQGEHYKASAYCFVSDSADVDAVCLTVAYSAISKNIVSGNTSSSYDLKRRGVWQKLEIDFVSSEGTIPILLSFWKSGVKDFSNLNGHIIFAYPLHEKISNLSLDTPSKLNFIGHAILKSSQNEADQKCSKILAQLKNQNDKDDHNINVYGKTILNNKIPSGISILKSQKYFFSGIFCFPLSIMSTSGLIQEDSDPIRNWASKFISEDTTYHPYKSNIVLDTISNSFIGDRASRWEFALKIFSKEYSWKQKLFGGGFNFLNWFGYYFDHDKTRSDYPHNPFLSILLYSGIFGLIIYLILMYKVFYYYIKYLEKYKILIVFFIITFFFSFFSAGSPFDPPVMGFFVILPFFIHSVHNLKNGPSDE